LGQSFFYCDFYAAILTPPLFRIVASQWFGAAEALSEDSITAEARAGKRLGHSARAFFG
jgi:hypothetical protein